MLTQVRFYVGGLVQERWTPEGWPVGPEPRPVSEEEWAGVALALAEFSDGWTEYQGRGMWQHSEEPTRIYEVLLGLPPARATVQRVAREMAGAAWQSKVLWTMTEVEGGRDGGMTTYKVVRFYFHGRPRTLQTGLTREQAQAHCHDRDTSSSTCTTRAGRARTRRMGPWFDGYAEER